METPLDNLLNRKIASLQDFRRNQERLWVTIGSGFLASEILIQSASVLPDLTEPETHRLVMWWTVRDYQAESLFLLLDTRLDEGIALLRMAAELVRDLARIADDADHLKIWLDRSNPQIKKRHRRIFRFNDDDELEKYIHKLYTLASDHGIHGHVRRSRH